MARNDRLRVVAVGGLIAVALALPFAGSDYLVFLLASVWTAAVVILGMNFMIHTTGLVSLGQAAVSAVGAYLAVILAAQHGVPVVVAVALGGAGAGVVGLVLAVAAVRVKGPYFSILTIIFGWAVPEILNLTTGITGGYNGMFAHQPTLGPLTSNATMYYFAFLVLLLGIWIIGNLGRSTIGRSLLIIKVNPKVASTCGIDPVMMQSLGVTVGNVLAGLGGGMFAFLTGAIAPSSFDFTQSAFYLIGAIVGGVVSPIGAILGAAVVTIVPQLLAGTAYFAGVLLGLILVASLTFLPDGLVGLRLGSAWRRRRMLQSQAMGGSDDA